MSASLTELSKGVLQLSALTYLSLAIVRVVSVGSKLHPEALATTLTIRDGGRSPNSHHHEIAGVGLMWHIVHGGISIHTYSTGYIRPPRNTENSAAVCYDVIRV